MPTLPDATALGERPAPAPNMGVAQYEPPNWRTVGVAGAILEGAGNQLQQAGAIIDATNKRYDKLAAEDAYNKLQEQAQNLAIDPNQGFKNVQGSGAIGQPFFKDYMGRFSDASQQIQQGLANDNQKQLFQQRAQIAGLQYRSQLLQHQAQQTEVFATNTENNSVKVELRNMAANPQDNNIFNAGLARINGVIDAKGDRQNLPPAQTEELKGQATDAAWSTRILSVMNGVPGAMDGNPYLAEKMFIEHQKELGPTAQVTLAHQVLGATKNVQQRDIAQGIIFGGKKTVDPQSLYPAIQNAKPLQAVVQQLESGGKRYDDNGDVLSSPKGALGEMQVMPATAANPGYGVTPAKDDSPEELARVGRDYLGAMTARYQDPVLTLAAYNAGPGQVDKWLAKYGDPRTGAITPQAFADKIPFAETAAYVRNGMRLVNADAGQPNAPISGPTAKELKTQLPALMEQARQVAQRMYPNDPMFADAVAARVANYGGTIVAQQSAQQQAATDMLTRGMVGTKPDGSDKPQSVDALLADPRMKQAWDQATPETQMAIQSRLAKGETKLTQEGLSRYDQLHGMAVNTPEAFQRVDLTQEYGKMPDHLVLSLINMRDAMTKDQTKAAARDLNWQRAKGDVEFMLKPLGLGAAAKPNTDQATQTETFYGKLQQAMQAYHDDPKNNKWPDTVTTQKMAASLLTPGKDVRPYWFDRGTRAFQSPDMSKFYVPVPSDQKPQLVKSFQGVMGHAPTDDELQQWYTRYQLSKGGK